MNWKTSLKILLHDKEGLAGLVIILFFIILSLLVQFAPGIFGITNPNTLITDENITLGATPPSPIHPLGTTYFGIDVLKAVLKGTKTDVFFSIPTILLALALGTIIGIFAGYYKGIVDELLMRITDIVFSIPYLIFLILFLSYNSSLFSQFIALGIALFPIYAKYSRAETRRIRESPIVLSSLAIGNSNIKTILYKVLPRVIYISLAQIPLTFGVLIGAFATLSYIKYVGNPTIPELGYIAGQSIQVFNINPWATIIPAIIITIITIGFNLLSLGIRKAIDPKVMAIWQRSQ